MEPLTTYFPFGPPIGYAKLPKELVDDFNEGCDNIVNDKKLSKSEDYSRKLVGQVQQELLIPKPIINKWGSWFGSQVREYVGGFCSQYFISGQNIFPATKEEVIEALRRMKIDVNSAWYVRSFAGDYNPVHTHIGCELTCVGFLKVPDLSKEPKKKMDNTNRGSPNGVLEVYSSIGVNSSMFENDRIGFVPKVGNWYLFPANIRHAVYPFKSDGERRSFSINMNTNMFKGETEK